MIHIVMENNNHVQWKLLAAKFMANGSIIHVLLAFFSIIKAIKSIQSAFTENHDPLNAIYRSHSIPKCIVHLYRPTIINTLNKLDEVMNTLCTLYTVTVHNMNRVFQRIFYRIFIEYSQKNVIILCFKCSIWIVHFPFLVISFVRIYLEERI